MPAITPDLWTELIFPQLTIRSLGLVSCVSKDMRRLVDRHQWERQAVLVWNGFYRSDNGPQCADQYLRERWTDQDEWCEWGDIMAMMGVVGVGYKVVHWIATDPVEVIRFELVFGGEMGELGRREWVEMAEDAWWDGVEEEDDEYTILYD